VSPLGSRNAGRGPSGRDADVPLRQPLLRGRPVVGYGCVSLFGGLPRGWQRVQAVCDWVHDHVTFGYEYARRTRTALEVYNERASGSISTPTSTLWSRPPRITPRTGLTSP
jgi:hypothetical protein